MKTCRPRLHDNCPRNTIRALLVITLLSAVATSAATLTLTPSTIAWNTNTWVGFDVNGIANGASVDLEWYVDVNRNGLVDGDDLLLAQFRLKDGLTNAFGAHIIACDTNGVADGRITGRFSFHGLTDLARIWRATGSYVWRAVHTNGVAITSAVFTVTQPTTTAWISGTVRALTNMATMTGPRLPGALVVPETFSLISGGMPATWTDTNGNFVIFIPDDLTTHDVAALMAVKPGYVSIPATEGGEPLSVYAFTGPLDQGGNAMAEPLFVVPPLPGAVPTVSGTITDDNNEPLGGVLLMIMPEDDEEEDIMALGISQPDGTFSIPWLNECWSGMVVSMSPLLNMRGYVGAGAFFERASGDISGIHLISPVATTLARVQVKKSESPGGVIGARINMFGDMTGSESYSFNADGLAELCLVEGGEGMAEIDRDSLRPLRRLCPLDIEEGLSFPPSGIYTQVTFMTDPGYMLSGRVMDTLMNPLPGGNVYVRSTNDYYRIDSQQPNFDGYYELLVDPGSYVAGTWGYVNVGYSDKTLPDIVVVTDQDVGDLDFILEQSAIISGQVLGNGSPLADARVEAFEVVKNQWGGWDWNDFGMTWSDADGLYQLHVPPGTNYLVRASGPFGEAWLEMYYDHADDLEYATPIATSVETPATNIHFNLEEGALIRGRVLGGGIPLEFAEVTAQTRNPLEGGGWVTHGVAWSYTDEYGDYTLVVRVGTSYIIRAQATEGAWLPRYYDNQPDDDSANPISPVLGVPTEDINFNLEEGALISGRVLADGQPLDNAQVNAETLTYDGDWWNTSGVAWDFTGPDGLFTLVVPPGTNYIVRAQGHHGSLWLPQYYDHVFQATSATRVVTGTDAPATNINFNLELGAVISGRVLGEGAPLQGAWVDAEILILEGEGAWMTLGMAWSPTDSTGFYSLLVPTGASYIIRAQGPYNESWQTQYYSNKTSALNADPVTPGLHAPATNINFNLLSMQPLTFVTDELPGATVLVYYSSSLEASGGNPPYHWYLPEGSLSLPPGLELSGSGLISGIPNTPGSFGFRVGLYTFDPYLETQKWFTVFVADASAPSSAEISRIATAAGFIYVYWPAMFTNYIPQRNDLMLSTNWTAAPETVMIEGTNRYIAIQSPTGQGYYRLMRE